MKTAVVMKRKLLGGEIAQNSKTEYFSGTDLVKVGNKWRAANGMDLFSMKNWLGNKGTKEFIQELEAKYDCKARIAARGKGSHTWLHPLLFIDMALAISPKIKLETYEWLFDQLINYRNDSGDSYKLMCGCLYARCTSKTSFRFYLSDVATKIRLACGVKDWNEATQEQLAKRDKIHNNIALLADVLNNNDEAVRIGIAKASGLTLIGTAQ